MPEEDIAGIYLVKQAEEAFYALPPERQTRLAAFLNEQRKTLRPPRESPRTRSGRSPARALKDCAYEWEPGCVVYWDVNLKPTEKTLSVTRISAYRIEVLEIKTDADDPSKWS
jgi:hypothetical protein